jgi:hypothetical protein
MLKNYQSNLLFFSFLVILIKWVTSYYYFNESLDVKIIFESVKDGKLYYPLIKFLSEFEFNKSFDPEINDLNIIPLPVTGILLHSFLLKFFGFSSFILADFICLFIFFYIFYKIFIQITSKNLSLILAILLYFLPIVISNSFLYDISYIKIFADNFYNLRVPRPMLSNLFFFGFLLIIVKLNVNFKYSYKLFIILGIISGLSLSSFFYHFFTQIFILILFFATKFKKKIFNELLNNYKYYLASILSFFLVITPFFLNITFHENEFTSRQCIFILDYDKKIILIKYLLTKYFSFKFLTLIFFITSLNLIVNYYNLVQKKIINVIYISFISSLIGPLLFILISNKSCVFYHFINFIILNGFLYIIFFIFLISNKFLRLNINNTCKYFILAVYILFFISLNWIIEKKKFNDQAYKDYRIEFSNITKKIKENYNLEDINLLTFETDLIIWSLMKDIKYLTVINALFTSKKDKMIEEDIYLALKVLNLNEKNLRLFIENRKSTWRYINNHISKFLYYKYQANSLVTFKNSKDFTNDELNHIKNTHLLLHQQSIIPKFELERYKKEFQKYQDEIIYPDVIILNKKDDFYDYKMLNMIKYCNIIEGAYFILYFKNINENCSY